MLFRSFLDCDGAFPATAVESFLGEALLLFQQDKGINAVISSRVKLSGRMIRRNKFRHYISRVIITLIGSQLSQIPYDSQSGLKIFRVTDNLIKALNNQFFTKWFFDLEVLISAHLLEGNQIWEQPVLAWHDISGSHLNWKKSPSLLREILTIIKLGRAATRNQM